MKTFDEMSVSELRAIDIEKMDLDELIYRVSPEWAEQRKRTDASFEAYKAHSTKWQNVKRESIELQQILK
jgi:hypothetical protein